GPELGHELSDSWGVALLGRRFNAVLSRARNGIWEVTILSAPGWPAGRRHDPRNSRTGPRPHGARTAASSVEQSGAGPTLRRVAAGSDRELFSRRDRCGQDSTRPARAFHPPARRRAR